VVQAFPSSHPVAADFGVRATHPLAGLHTLAFRHAVSPGHPTAVPWHSPSLPQTSPVVHSEPSLQASPVRAPPPTQVPVLVSQVWAFRHMVAPGQVTFTEPAQTPPVQVSGPVQALPSSQPVPFGRFAPPSHWPFAGLQLLAAWQAIPTAHVRVGPIMHTPFWQLSVVHRLLSTLQAVPLVLLIRVHIPVAASQLPAIWQAVSGQGTAPAPTHMPAWAPPPQLSVGVQALPSLQLVPGSLFGTLHTPSAGSQAAGSWHWPPPPVHETAVPAQAPARQASAFVQRFMSLQVLPSALGGLVQRPVVRSQVPASWH
jgi:hypothetical protein